MPIRSIDRLVPELLSAMRRRFPAARICGGGLGWRQRRAAAADEPRERALRVFVPRKICRQQARREGRTIVWLPPRTHALVRLFNRTHEITVPIDVDEIQAAIPTWFSIGTPGNDTQSAAAFATWRADSGMVRTGVVTAGHGFWRKNNAGGFDRLTRSRVQLADGTTVAGRLLDASLLGPDRVDVALVAVAPQDLVGHGWPVAPDGLPGTQIPGLGRYAGLLGGLVDDDAVPASLRAANITSDRCIAMAWYERVRVHVSEFGTLWMNGVVETHCGPDSPGFLPGTSGAPIFATAPSTMPLGIQSLCLDPGTWRRSYATDFRAAERWLRERVHPSLRLHWQPA
ncbi:MAG: hypothetical protein IPK26_13865 [Planctomycetes bacterium]|nr:hypothetical protein [Planctomycetota bacterium]